MFRACGCFLINRKHLRCVHFSHKHRSRWSALLTGLNKNDVQQQRTPSEFKAIAYNAKSINIIHKLKGVKARAQAHKSLRNQKVISWPANDFWLSQYADMHLSTLSHTKSDILDGEMCTQLPACLPNIKREEQTPVIWFYLQRFFFCIPALEMTFMLFSCKLHCVTSHQSPAGFIFSSHLLLQMPNTSKWKPWLHLHHLINRLNVENAENVAT